MKKKVEVIREGLARARFGAAIGEAVLPGQSAPLRFAAGEGNGGLSAEEFLVRPWRILSAALTPYRYFDFTGEGVLEAAVPLFEGLTLYANHTADVNNWKGFVQEPVWDAENAPPGINALFVLDKTVDANLARGVEIGALRSASVTIWFEYERSHPELRNFYDRLGEEIEGEVVRFVVTRIVQAGEVSIVWEGEDPHAKALSAESLAAPESLDEPGDGNQPENGGIQMEFGKAFLQKLGIDQAEGLTADVLEGKVSEKLKAFEDEIAALKPDAALGKQLLEETRERAEQLYKALKGEDARESFINNIIKTADLETARALLEEYEGGMEESIPLTCPDCGAKLTRRSSQESGDGKDHSGKNPDDYKV